MLAVLPFRVRAGEAAGAFCAGEADDSTTKGWWCAGFGEFGVAVEFCGFAGDVIQRTEKKKPEVFEVFEVSRKTENNSQRKKLFKV